MLYLRVVISGEWTKMNSRGRRAQGVAWQWIASQTTRKQKSIQLVPNQPTNRHFDFLQIDMISVLWISNSFI